MSEKKYVDLDTVFDKLEDEWGYKGIRDELYSLPTADVAEVVHGKWLLEREPNGKPYCYHCSVCDDDFHYIGITTASDYCPNCGAKMDKEQERNA